MKKAPKDWWKDFFVPDFYTPADATHLMYAPEEARFAAKALGLGKGSSLLDLCCGPGRHAIWLAKKGVRVTGLDQSAPYIGEARRRSSALATPPAFVRGDMRSVPFGDAAFDAAMNLFTSFGYFPRAADDLRALREVSRVLKPGGFFLLDVMNRGWLLKNFSKRSWTDLGRGDFLIEKRDLSRDKTRLATRWIRLRADGRRLERSFALRLYDRPRIEALLRKAGLRPARFWGSFAGARLSDDASRLIVLSKKF